MVTPVGDSKLVLESIKKQMQDLIKVKESLNDLFTRALGGEDIDKDLKTEISKISLFSDEVEKNKIRLFTQAFVFCTHLSKWEIICELIESPLCAKIYPPNFSAAFWKAGFEGRTEVICAMQKKHPDFFRERDRRFVFFAKRGLIDKMDYHAFPKDED